MEKPHLVCRCFWFRSCTWRPTGHIYISPGPGVQGEPSGRIGTISLGCSSGKAAKMPSPTSKTFKQGNCHLVCCELKNEQRIPFLSCSAPLDRVSFRISSTTTNTEHLNGQHLDLLVLQTIFPNCNIWRHTILAVVQKDDPAAHMSADIKSTKHGLIKREILIHSLIIHRLASVKLIILEIRPNNVFEVVPDPGLKCLDKFGVLIVLFELFNDLL